MSGLKRGLNTYRELVLAIEKNKIMPFAEWVQLSIIVLCEVSQKEKDKYYMTSLTCVI